MSNQNGDVDVSVVLPTYNEAATITRVVDNALLWLGKTADVEVIVVDDDSPDGTAELARRTYRADDRVQVIQRTSERGLSSAVLRGFLEARGRYAICMDADGQHPADRLPRLLAELQDGADVVVGSRHVDGGSIEGWARSRILTSKGATLLARAFVPAARELTDPMSGFFGVDRDVVDDEILEIADPHGYKILLELVALVSDAELRDVPITFRDRQAGESKLTLDEQIHYVEHVAGLAMLSLGLDERVTAPQLIRAAEASALTAIALPVLFIGIIIGDVDGAVGAALIATSGAAIAMALGRVFKTGSTWSETRRESV